MSEWRGDPALGCGLMLLSAAIVCLLVAGLMLAFVWSRLVP